jgi:malate synthase
MHAGPVKPKHNGAMKAAPWLQAYEKSNVAAGLAHRLVGKGQIGKGMWAEPDNMNGLPRTHIRIPQGLRVSDCV